MSNSIASDMTPAISRGGRFTTNNACLPSISRGFARSLAFHSSQNSAPVVAEVDAECDQLFRIGNVAHGFDCANSNVDLVQKFGRNRRLHFSGCHSAILLGMLRTTSGRKKRN